MGRQTAHLIDAIISQWARDAASHACRKGRNKAGQERVSAGEDRCGRS
jgi:hypothetical protein